jgi:hypothetical protein
MRDMEKEEKGGRGTRIEMEGVPDFLVFLYHI